MHVMLDLETMGSRYRAAIVSIGAVEFDVDQMGREFSINVSLESCVAAGLKIEPVTVTWWLQQTPAALMSLRQPPPLPLVDALHAFSRWFPPAPVCLWGYGCGFDNARLREAYEAVWLTPPWHYRDDRDVRTLLELAGEPEALRVERDDKHSALADARFQAEVCSRLLAKVQERS